MKRVSLSACAPVDHLSSYKNAGGNAWPHGLLLFRFALFQLVLCGYSSHGFSWNGTFKALVDDSFPKSVTLLPTSIQTVYDKEHRHFWRSGCALQPCVAARGLFQLQNGKANRKHKEIFWPCPLLCSVLMRCGVSLKSAFLYECHSFSVSCHFTMFNLKKMYTDVATN